MLSSALVSDMMSRYVPATLYGGLLLQAPFSTIDPLSIEVFSATYSRPATGWAQTAIATNSNAMHWLGLPPGTIVHGLGLFDEPFNGRLLFGTDCAPIHFPDGGSLSIDAGSLTFGLTAQL